MAHGKSLELAKIKPRFRHSTDEDGKIIAQHFGPGRAQMRRSKWGSGKHTYTFGFEGSKDRFIDHHTQESLSTKRARNRRRNKAARAARKVNR